ncbi:MAG: fumarylacetoacetate hydrolase family protein [Bacteroidia bacterium]|nr:fumarylacetoacetate hydrolase family protein [Bacteroidia bacterium]MDW8334525.1 fumarylacetoacetate hydrolase family protein [Bacteroidia bacterium]
MKIVCVGRNYRAHAEEMGHAAPENPVLFIKPDGAVLGNGEDFFHPDFSREIHYECEVFFRIAKDAKGVNEAFAASYVDGYGLGVDFTARDLQNELKARGLPWEISKAFDGSAFVSEIFPLPSFAHAQNIEFELHKNGRVAQRANTSQMIFDLATLLAYATRFFTLRAGDLLFTGTPSGVGRVERGDRLEGFLDGRKAFDFRVR